MRLAGYNNSSVIVNHEVAQRAEPRYLKIKGSRNEVVMYRGFGKILLPAIVLLSFTFPPTGCAQDAPKAVRSAVSAGLNLSISKISAGPQGIVIQVSMRNDTKARAYIVNLLGEDERALLGAGRTLQNPEITGLNRCTQNTNSCSDRWAADLNNFSYIEPGEFTIFGLSYRPDGPLVSPDTISFSLAFLVRFEESDKGTNQATASKVVRFNFPSLPLSQ